MLSTSWINAAAAMPIITAMAIIQGISSIEFMVRAGTLNAGSEPYTTWVTMAALTAARMMGVNPAMVYSIITTSMAKITPEMGVLNEAEMAAAQPQATRVRMLLLGRRIHWPSRLENAAPRCTAGPSRPADWPLTTVATPATNCTTALRNEM